jgi:hypothetical protein
MIPSPFPGMALYLEAPSIWPDEHTSLTGIGTSYYHCEERRRG